MGNITFGSFIAEKRKAHKFNLRDTASADLPDYIMEKDIVRAALRVAKEVDATDEEWQTFMKMLKERKR